MINAIMKCLYLSTINLNITESIVKQRFQYDCVHWLYRTDVTPPLFCEVSGN